MSRSRGYGTALLLFVALAGAACVGIHRDENRPPWAGAWITPWDYEKGIEALNQSDVAFSDVYFFWVQLNAQGEPTLINPNLETDDVRLALKKRQARVWLTFVNDVAASPGNSRVLKDAAVVSRMLSDDTSRKNHRAQIIRLAQNLDVTGIDIDYENLLSSDRDLFSRFIAELAADAHALKLELSVTVQPKQGNTTSTGPGAADWPALCKSADRVQIMLYNEHSGKTGPGPIATTAWMGKVLRYAESQCARSRLAPVIKIIGAAWGDDRVLSITYDQTLGLRRERNITVDREEPDQVPHFATEMNGSRATIYYEDALSAGAKLNYLRSLGFNSVVLWSLGSNDPALYARVREYTRLAP